MHSSSSRLANCTNGEVYRELSSVHIRNMQSLNLKYKIIPTDIYPLKINYRNTRTTCEIC